MSYRESQSSKPWWVWLFVVGASAGAMVPLLESEEPVAAGAWWLAGGVALLAFAVIWALRLVIRVEADALRWRLIPIWGGRLPLESIREARVVPHRPLSRGGWGLRWMPGRGWSATLFTGGAVHLDLEDDRSFLLSSKRPDALAAALAEQGVALGPAESA